MTDIQTDYFTPCTYTQGNHVMMLKYICACTCVFTGEKIYHAQLPHHSYRNTSRNLCKHRKKISRIKISSMRAGGKIGENFLLANISGYRVYFLYYMNAC